MSYTFEDFEREQDDGWGLLALLIFLVFAVVGYLFANYGGPLFGC